MQGRDPRIGRVLLLLLVQRHIFAHTGRRHLLWRRSNTQFDWRWQFGGLFFLLFLVLLLTVQAAEDQTQYGDEPSKTSYDTTRDCTHSALVRASR